MWWQQQALEQWLNDFLRDALRKRGVNLTDLQENPCDLLSDPRKFGFSSLNMMQLASRFAACMGLDRTGLSDLLLARRSAKGWCEIVRRSREINDEEMGFYSSGSTASPQLTRHQTSALLAEAEFFARTLPICRRVVSTVPSHHIYGFIWSILVPDQLRGINNAPRVFPHMFVDTANSLPASWAQELNDHDMIIATPDTWQLLKELDVPLPKYFVGISSTAPLHADTAGFLRANYPEAILAEIYGSTETAGIAWRIDNAGFTLLPWWELSHTGQATMACSSISNQCHKLQDRIVLNSDGTIQVTGRIDNVVTIAGHNIDLDTLAEKISTHPDVKAAKVQHDQHGDGARLHYFIAATHEPDNLVHWCIGFSHWLEQQLGDVPVPASIVVATTLPRGVNNKTVTWDPNLYHSVIGVYRSGF